MIIMGHFKVLRAHNEWRVGHEFHAEVTARLIRLEEMGFLYCIGGTAEPDPAEADQTEPEATSDEVAEEPKRKGRGRGVKVRDGQVGDDGLRPQDD